MMSVPAPFTDQQIADQITRDGLHWGTTTITYSFNDLSTGGNALDATQIAWIEAAITMVEELFGLDFVLVGSSGDITFNGSSGNGTYASTSYFPSSGEIAGSNIFFDQSWSSNQSANLDYGSYGFTTIIHEFLHALGLDHPGDYNAGSGGPITYLNDAEFEQDTHRYTVMSYFDAPSDNSGSVFFQNINGSNVFIYPQTPMVYDILAMTDGSFDGLFSGYDANTTTRTEDTTYGYNATAGINEVFDFDFNGAPVLTIYDAGGVDTLDFSGDTVLDTYTVNYNPDGSIAGYTLEVRTTTVIDLREGQYSSTHGMVNNIGIAFGTVIENAIGTQFKDTIYGNDVANLLEGGDGGDVIWGFDGKDTLEGGDGWDNLKGGNGGDTLIGGSGNDIIYGGADWDKIWGGNNHDSLYGGSGNDMLAGGKGRDTVNGGGGQDTLFGGNGIDTLNGGGGADILDGGKHDDSLTGGAGADIFDYNTLNFGQDTITDWEDGVDMLDFSTLGLDETDFTISQQGDDTLISLNSDPAQTILLVDVLASTIDGSDFV